MPAQAMAGRAEGATASGAAYASMRQLARPASKAQEQRWLLAHLPLVKRVVRRLASQVSGVLDSDDMEQIGLIGLLEALRRYGEPDDDFAGYAALRIRGAVLDELRRLDWRPRGARQSAHKLRKAERALRQALGREPTRAEVCAALDISPEQGRELELAGGAEIFASFDELLADRGDFAGAQEGPERAVVDRATLAAALNTLDPREQQVIQLYYEYELSQNEIAEVLERTPARICQITKSALAKMKLFLSRQ